MAHFFVSGDLVEKYVGDYGGPGRVVSAFATSKGQRVVVAHKIEGGFGEFMHIYSSTQLRLVTAAKEIKDAALEETRTGDVRRLYRKLPDISRGGPQR